MRCRCLGPLRLHQAEFCFGFPFPLLQGTTLKQAALALGHCTEAGERWGVWGVPGLPAAAGSCGQLGPSFNYQLPG